MADERATQRVRRLGRRAALRAGAVGLGLGLAAGPGLGVAGAASASWRTLHLEVDFTPSNSVSIVRAGEGPPQRGDWFYVDGPIYAADRVGGAEIGRYQCFGAWTAASTETAAHDQRLTTVQFHLFGTGAIMGLINEGGADHNALVGAVQGGTGAYAGALGTFRQIFLQTPPQQVVLRGSLDLMLPDLGPAAQVPA